MCCLEMNDDLPVVKHRWTQHADFCVHNRRLLDLKIWQVYKMLRRQVKNAFVRLQIWALDNKQRRTRVLPPKFPMLKGIKLDSLTPLSLTMTRICTVFMVAGMKAS